LAKVIKKHKAKSIGLKAFLDNERRIKDKAYSLNGNTLPVYSLHLVNKRSKKYTNGGQQTISFIPHFYPFAFYKAFCLLPFAFSSCIIQGGFYIDPDG
jgi:hypothetical protein